VNQGVGCDTLNSQLQGLGTVLYWNLNFTFTTPFLFDIACRSKGRFLYSTVSIHPHWSKHFMLVHTHSSHIAMNARKLYIIYFFYKHPPVSIARWMNWSSIEWKTCRRFHMRSHDSNLGSLSWEWNCSPCYYCRLF